MQSHTPESFTACCLRVFELLDFLGDFYRRELECTEKGSVQQLAGLQEKRDESLKAAEELAALLDQVRRRKEDISRKPGFPRGAEEKIEKIEERVRELCSLARESCEQSSRLKECVLEGFTILRSMKKAYVADKDGTESKGVLIDKEG